MILNTDRLKIIPLTMNHMKLMLQDIASMERDLGLVLSGEKLDEHTLEAMQWLYNQSLSHPESQTWFTNWQIILREKNIAVGSACFKGPPDENGNVELGYGIYVPHQNHGYMTEAARALYTWALSMPGVKAVTAETEPNNLASHHVLEKCELIKYEENDESVFWVLGVAPDILSDAKRYASHLFSSDFSGHDIHHTLRVFRTATILARKENANLRLVQLAALLHDTDDPKLFPSLGSELPHAVNFLHEHGFSENEINDICHIISQVSFKGTDSCRPDSLEGMVVQDADRLDALGAIGIARAFAYGGSKNRPMYDPSLPYIPNMNAEKYFSSQGSSINHFYEKLLLLKDMMNTPAARLMAEQRDTYMRNFLKEFYSEWNGLN